MSQLHTVT